MESEETTPVSELKEKRSTGTLVRMYLIFTLIPLASMAGVVYFGARALLREQAVRNTESYLTAELNVIGEQVRYKEERLDHLLGSSDFKILMELALHANPTSNEFNQIHES